MGYTVGNIKHDFDSINNQEIKGKWVGQNVNACVTSMVNYIIGKQYEYGDRGAPFEIDDIENYYTPICPECDSDYGFTETEACKCDCCGTIRDTGERSTICSGCTEVFGEMESDEEPATYEIIEIHKCDECGHYVEDTSKLDTKPQEVYEWWIVSNWMMEKLKARGNVVIPHMNIWGRTCTGQAIKLDGIISTICHEMGILDGPEYSWKAT